MIIGTNFDGDNNEELKMYQHKTYYERLRCWVRMADEKCQQYIGVSAEWNELIDRWRKNVMESGGFDHRCIQAPHDLIAAQHRKLLMDKPFSTYRKKHEWRGFFNSEADACIVYEEFLKTFMTALACSGSETGYEAEDKLCMLMQLRYGTVTTEKLKSENIKAEGKMSKVVSVRARVKEFLEKKTPLSLVTLDDLYPQFTSEQSHSVRAALYGISVGTPVSERNCPSKYFAIRLKLKNKEVFLSLPGVPSEVLKKDILSKKRTESIIAELQTKYGKQTIDYWVQSAQHRSVVLAASGMRAAKKRDNKTCLLCGHEGNDTKQPVSACHIISRKTLFWEALYEVEKFKGNIFTEEAVSLLKSKLKNEDLHSNLKYIVTLCTEHDNTLQAAFDESLKKGKKAISNPLFDSPPAIENKDLEVRPRRAIFEAPEGYVLKDDEVDGMWALLEEGDTLPTDYDLADGPVPPPGFWSGTHDRYGKRIPGFSEEEYIKGEKW